jgi:hypothetical protein
MGFPHFEEVEKIRLTKNLEKDAKIPLEGLHQLKKQL